MNVLGGRKGANMDIYEYFNSKDIAKHCRKIGKQWTPFEMAQIISRSKRPLADRHAGWKTLMDEYPDVPVPKNMHCEGYPSMHAVIKEHIRYDDYWLSAFMRHDDGAVYMHIARWYDDVRHSDSVFTDFDKAWADATDYWVREEAPVIWVKKIYPNNGGSIEVKFDYDQRPLYTPDVSRNSEDESGYLPKDGFNKDMLVLDGETFYLDVPTPFEVGDILTVPKTYFFDKDNIFIVRPHDENVEKLFARYRSGEFGDASDMIEWGFHVEDDGILYGDHTGPIDSFEYYMGKLEGKDRLLHYLSLFMKGEIGIVELLTMQNRLVVETFTEESLCYMNHGCNLLKRQLAENRVTDEEMAQIREGKMLAPWVGGKVTLPQVEFIKKEFGGDYEKIENELSELGGWYLGRLAGIAHDENYYERTGNPDFNPQRRETARAILAAYGHTEKGCVDSHAKEEDD